MFAKPAELYNQSKLLIKPAIYQTNKAEQETKLPPRTTVIEKKSDDDVIPEKREYHTVKIKRGDSLRRLIRQVGAESWQAAAISDAMNKVVPSE